MKKNYVVAGHKSWNKEHFEDIIRLLPGNWVYISQKEQLTLPFLNEFDPRYIFFLHWSYTVPEDITNKYECVCFHMTDVPYGRGGSPLQNLIVRGHQATQLTALRMTGGLDSGPVYYKINLSLDGKAEDIYKKASVLSCELIKKIIENTPEPVPQVGQPVIFKRRTKVESEIPPSVTLDQIYDYIRMLDAEGYPCAFIKYGKYKLSFTNASLAKDSVMANVIICRDEK